MSIIGGIRASIAGIAGHPWNDHPSTTIAVCRHFSEMAVA